MRRLTIFAGALAALVSAPASAQLLPPSAASPSDRPLSQKDQAWDTMNRFGICIVKTNPGMVKRALAQPDAAAIDKALHKIAADECLADGQLTMSGNAFRGALYRALYLKDFPTLSSGTEAALGDLKTPDRLSSVDFGRCVVHLSPANARVFVMSSPGTSRQREALAALRPALGDCLPPGVKVTLTPWGIQGSLAEALYNRTVELTKAAPGMAAAKTGG